MSKIVKCAIYSRYGAYQQIVFSIEDEIRRHPEIAEAAGKQKQDKEAIALDTVQRPDLDQKEG